MPAARAHIGTCLTRKPVASSMPRLPWQFDSTSVYHGQAADAVAARANASSTGSHRHQRDAQARCLQHAALAVSLPFYIRIPYTGCSIARLSVPCEQIISVPYNSLQEGLLMAI